MPKQKQLERPTTSTGWEAWYVEWGRTGARRRGTVVATRADAAAEWSWIQPQIQRQFADAPTSRRPTVSDATRAIIVVTMEQTTKDGREVWQGVDFDDRPRFVAPKLGALTPLQAPHRPQPPRPARTRKAGRSTLADTGALA